MNSEEVLFPHENFRKIQSSLVQEVRDAVNNSNNLVINAPTGIGKTASALAPALAYAMKSEKTVFFLTSRHTQHRIVLKTAKKIKEKYDLNFGVTSIVGKKWLCAVEGVQTLTSSDFSEYCKAVREDDKCDFYSKTKKKGKTTIDSELAVVRLKERTPLDSEIIQKEMKQAGLCPYEISTLLCENSKVIVCDYYYLFNPSIRERFLTKIGKNLEDSIIIVDEAHNLGERIKDLASAKINSFILSRALKESRKHDPELNAIIEKIVLLLESETGKLEGETEKRVNKNFLIEGISRIVEYDEVIKDLEKLADTVREEQRISFLGSLAGFLENWSKDEEGHVRIISKEEDFTTLSYRCLDPSIIAKEVIDVSSSVIIMSGTLTPTSMYKEILGFSKETKEITYPDPFPEENKLLLVVPKTTTKYKERSEQQYENIAEHCSKIISKVPGNVIIFFPSYFLRNEVHRKLTLFSEKPLLLESSNSTKEEKQKLLEEFKGFKETGACLMAVSSGSFSESINLHGDFLKAVIVVGLPLQKPNLETKSLIDYYETKFGKGWDYGYLIPAFNKVMQSAGRCIRSEKDRGVIVFLDKRYALDIYFRLFPDVRRVKVTVLYESFIDNFFKKAAVQSAS